MFVECLCWCLPSEGLPGPAVEGGGDGLDLFDGPALLDPTAQEIGALDLGSGVGDRCESCGSVEVDAPVWPSGVVVLDVDGEYVLEVASVPDQCPVEALVPYCSDPALGVGVGLGRSHRGLHDAHAVGGEDRVEALGELGVAVADEELKAGVLARQAHGQVAGLLGYPGAAGTGAHSCQPHRRRSSSRRTARRAGRAPRSRR